MSESFRTAAFLSVSGGLQDAYTYIFRDKVFANAQTGNIVLLSQCIANRDLELSIHYIVPLLFFAVGIAVAEIIHGKFKEARRLHWRQLVLLSDSFLRNGIFLPMRWYPFPVQCRYRHSAR